MSYHEIEVGRDEAVAVGGATVAFRRAKAVGTGRARVKLAVDAPPSMRVVRGELAPAEANGGDA